MTKIQNCATLGRMWIWFILFFQLRQRGPRFHLLWLGLIGVSFLLSSGPLHSFAAEGSKTSTNKLNLREISDQLNLIGQRQRLGTPPGNVMEPFIRADLAVRLHHLRPQILASAARHNQPQRSGLSDAEFASAMVTIIYNEHHGWFEDVVPLVRPLTPWYQHAQSWANQTQPSANFSVWPANLRPSVGREIISGQVPLSDGSYLRVPIRIYGSQIELQDYQSDEALLAAINGEIMQDSLAIEYLAANLERAIYRAENENQPISWRTLAAWHNQGIVDPHIMRENATTRDYLRRATTYYPLAQRFVRGQRLVNSLEMQ